MVSAGEARIRGRGRGRRVRISHGEWHFPPPVTTAKERHPPNQPSVCLRAPCLVATQQYNLKLGGLGK